MFSALLRNARTTFFVFVIGELISCSAVGNDLRGELFSGLNNAKKLFSTCSVRGTYTRESSKAGVYEDYNAGIYHSSSVIQRFFDKDTKQETIKVVNPKYGFIVSRRAGSEKFTLSFLSTIVDAKFEERISLQRQGVYFTVLCNYFLMGRLLWDHVEHPDFELLSLKEISTEKSPRLVRCDFKIAPTKEKFKYLLRSYSGYFVCDPSQNWAMVESFCVDDGNSLLGVQRNVEAMAVDGQLPVCKRLTSSVVGKDRKLDLNPTKNWELKELDKTPLEEEMLFLRSYGLPEPNFGRGWLGWFASWVWYLIIGVVCIAIALLLVRRQNARS